MPRDWLLFLDDMIACCEKLRDYRRQSDRAEFDRRSMAFDAMVRNVELLGEAAARLPAEVRDAMPDVPWTAIVGMRHRLAHAYFGIDPDILWDVVETEAPALHRALRTYRAGLTRGQ